MNANVLNTTVTLFQKTHIAPLTTGKQYVGQFWVITWLSQRSTISLFLMLNLYSLTPPSQLCHLLHENKLISKYKWYIFYSLLIFRQREEKREKEKHRYESVTSINYLPHTPIRYPAYNLSICPWPGIESASSQYTGEHPTKWPTPARANILFSSKKYWVFRIKIYIGVFSQK